MLIQVFGGSAIVNCLVGLRIAEQKQNFNGERWRFRLKEEEPDWISKFSSQAFFDRIYFNCPLYLRSFGVLLLLTSPGNLVGKKKNRRKGLSFKVCRLADFPPVLPSALKSGHISLAELGKRGCPEAKGEKSHGGFKPIFNILG